MRPKKGLIEGPRGKVHRKKYNWTSKKVEMLEKLVEEGYTNDKILEILNERFGGRKLIISSVCNRISGDIYRRRPELKKGRSRKWTAEKVRVLEKLVGEGLSNGEIAERLNERFGGNATEQIVKNKLNNDKYAKA
jgi:hypothetical protein